MPHLEYRDESGQILRAELGEEAVLGRQLDCTIRLPEDRVSRRHARIVRKESRWHLEDLGSRHGTLLNQSRLSGAAPLAEGDRITVGEVVFVFREAPLAVGRTVPGLPERRPSWSGRGITTTSGLVVPAAPLLLTPALIESRLRAAPDLEAALKEALVLAMDATRANRGLLALREGSTLRRKIQLAGRDRAPAPKALHISEKFVELMLEEKTPRVTIDTDSDRQLSSADSVVTVDIRSILGAPLLVNEEVVVGYLYLDTLGERGERRGRSFRRTDLEAVRELAEAIVREVDRRGD